MATNPITSDDLTIDFQSLLAIPVGDRVQAAALDKNFSQALIASLTPIQMAKAFPDYYRKELPDISNFILANRYLDKVGSGGFDQRGGGDYGKDYDRYGGETAVPSNRTPTGAEPSIEEMKKTLLRKGIDVEGTYSAIEQGGSAILEGDSRFSYIKKMSDEELKEAGLRRTQDENGKNLIQLIPTEASTLSKDEVMRKASDKIIPGTTGLKGRAAIAKQTYDAFVEAGLSDKQARAAVAEVNRENSLNPKYIFGTHTEVAAQAGGRTNYGMFSWGDPSRVKSFRAYMQKNGVMDPAGNLLVDNDTYLKQQAKFAVEEMKGYETGRKFLETKDVSADEATNLLGRYIGWDMAGRRHDAAASYDRLKEGRKIIDEVNDKMGKLLPENPTDAQVEEARKILDQKEREGWSDALIRQQFNKASPTTTDTAIKGESAVIENQGKVARTRRQPITPELKEVLQYAGEESGVVVEVFSGGQNDITEGGDRTGSERHDLGHAADVKLKVKGPDGKMRVLDARNPEDRIIMGKFVETARMMGAKGIGSGINYMGESGIHVGTVLRSDLDYSDKSYGAPAGKEAIWRSDSWAEEAFTRGQQAAVDFEKAGGMAEYRKRREERIAEQQKKESDKTVAAKQETVQINNEIIPHDHAGETAEEHAAEPQKTAAVETPAPKFRTGGSPETQDDENLSVYDENGNIRWKMNSGEGVYVKPEANEYADTKMEELSGRVDEIDERMANQPNNNKPTPNKPEKNWQQHVANMVYSPGTQGRAFKRTKFQNEGFHWGRGSPNSSLS